MEIIEVDTISRQKYRSQQSITKQDKASQISQYDLPRQHVLVNTSQLCETLSPDVPCGSQWKQFPPDRQSSASTLEPQDLTCFRGESS